MNSSTRETLERRVSELMDEVLLLGSMVEQATLTSVRALKDRNIATAEDVYTGDLKINEKRYEIEERTITLIATQQPMARDLRTLTAILEIITEMERMGDYAKGIARITLNMGSETRLKPPPSMMGMAEVGVDMLHKALEAFVGGKVDMARAIPKQDDEVDTLFLQVQSEIMEQMAANPDKLEKINQLLWACHNLERLADRVINICERTIFIATGELLEFDATDDEQGKLKVRE